MILQELYKYYERKAALGDIAPIGFEWKQIPFIIIIDNEGNLRSLKDTREKNNKKLIAKSFLVPRSVVRSGSNSWQTTFLLWDHWGYVLGYPKGDALKDRSKRHTLLKSIKTDNEYLNEFINSEKMLKRLALDDIENLLNVLNTLEESKDIKSLTKNLVLLKKSHIDSEKQFTTFQNSIENLPEYILNDSAIQAIQYFYVHGEYKKVFEFQNWMDCAAISGANITFQIEGENSLVLSRNLIMEYQKKQTLIPENSDAIKSFCLISGKDDYIQRIHNSTPIFGGQSTGKLVGFQKSSGFDSYGKEQGFNAPVGRDSQDAYTTALNTLIKSKTSRIILGKKEKSTTILFWGEKKTELEHNFPLLFVNSKDDPDQDTPTVKQLYESIYSGKLNTETERHFFVLGLSPNAARISVRYWLTGTVAEFAMHIKQHFGDLDIVRGNKDSEFFALSTLLSNTALKYDLDNVAPNMAGQVTEAVLKGTPYPKTLLFAAVRRIRAEQHITRVRAAIIKACINRFNRFHNKNEEEITVALDKTNMNPAYRLGRLFAVLERIQSKALNVETIRERYYGAFSSTPVTVYPQLMKLKNHHLAKLEKGAIIYYERIIGEIIDGLDGSGLIPRQFSLEEQGRFAVGYYHQRQEFYKKKDSNNYNETSKENEL